MSNSNPLLAQGANKKKKVPKKVAPSKKNKANKKITDAKAPPPPPEQRREKPEQALDGNAHYRHPLTVLTILLPLGLIAEVYRFLGNQNDALLVDETWAQAGAELGIQLPIIPLLVLIIACITVLLVRKMTWEFPSFFTIGKIAAWALVWATVRVVLGMTTDSITLDATSPPLINDQPEQELSLLGYIGLAMSGALQEELIFRGALIGATALLLKPFIKSWTVCLSIMVPVSAVIFALAHTSVINPAYNGMEIQMAQCVQHVIAGILYGIIFIRQGLAVSTLTHCFYNIAVYAQFAL